MLLFQYFWFLHQTVWFLDKLTDEDYTEDDGNTEMKRRSGYIKNVKNPYGSDEMLKSASTKDAPQHETQSKENEDFHWRRFINKK